MTNLRGIAAAAARRYGIDPNIFLRQIAQESGFNPNARSRAGAIGIAQFMPATARAAGVNPLDPRSALYGAARMDAQNLRKYGNWRDVLSLYNSGRGWSQGQRIGETRNYVRSILGGSPGVARALPAASSPAQATAGPDSSGLRAALAQNLIAASQANASGQSPDYSQTFSLVQALRAAGSSGPAPVRLARTSLAEAAHGVGKRGGLRELFYDPIGAVKNDRPIPAIGGHRDHVHIATANAQEMVLAIEQAKALGLHVSENPFVGKVHPVHVKDSNHYRVLGRVNGRAVGGAADISGTPAQMARYFRWAQERF